MSTEKKPIGTRADYPHHLAIPTRWMDNDLYGHVNNVVYYSYFDTLLNRYLIDHGGFDIHNAGVIGIAVETFCRFHRSFAYPEVVDGGLRVGHLGTSSVRYEIGLFGQGDDTARAEGHFVHVFVDRSTQRPVPIPDPIRAALARIRRS
ncbi:MAG: acyl-CoA thioesterase [Hyphomicrobiaceae bacterium]|nr:acyl-CoA thioesterase [Hyphomicrobiaceae bacterium]